MPIDQLKQNLRLERLDQIVRRTLPHGIDGPRNSPEGGHQQHRNLRVILPDQGQQLVAIHTRHIHVTHHQAEWFLLQGS